MTAYVIGLLGIAAGLGCAVVFVATASRADARAGTPQPLAGRPAVWAACAGALVVASVLWLAAAVLG